MIFSYSISDTIYNRMVKNTAEAITIKLHDYCKSFFLNFEKNFYFDENRMRKKVIKKIFS